MALIEREALRQRFENYRRDCEEAEDTVAAQVFADCICELDDVPTIAAAPVVHGRWVMRGGRFRCSVCDTKALWRDVGGTGGWSHEYEQATTYVCPNCGARMDGGEKHEAD